MSLELHLHHEYTFIIHFHHQLPITPAVVMRYSLSHKNSDMPNPQLPLILCPKGFVLNMEVCCPFQNKRQHQLTVNL